MPKTSTSHSSRARPLWRMSALVVLLLLAIFAQAAHAALIGGSAAPAPTLGTARSPDRADAPKAYVGLFKDNAVAVVDTLADRVLSTIPVPPGPHGLVVTPDGRKAYVSSDGASTVSVIDTATDRVMRSIEVGPTPHGLAITPNGDRVLVAGFGSNRAEIVDTSSDQVVGQVPVPQPHNSAISPDGRTAYVGSQQQGATALAILDLTAMAQLGSVPLDRTPRALSFSPDGKWLYFTVAGADAVQVLDPATNQVVAHIAVGASPHFPVFTPDGQYGLVVSQGPGELALLDPASSSVSATLTVGSAPHWIAISSDGRTAYVTNETSNDLSVVDLASRQVTATMPVGNGPRKIAVQPGPAVSAAPGPSTGTTTQASGSIKLGDAGLADHGMTDATGHVSLKLEADDYYFSPTFIRGQPGQKLTLEVANESGTLHNLSMPALGLDNDIPPRGTAEVEVSFPDSGTVRFFCKFHAALGMSGELQAV